MGNCTASKLGGEEEGAVSLCRERKRLLKAAVESRHVLADAYERYIHSLHAVAGAINLFVARHSAPCPVLTLPSSSFPPSSSSDPSFLSQTPSEPKVEALVHSSSASSSTSSVLASTLKEEREGDEGGGVGEEMGCSYFFSDMPAGPPSPSCTPSIFGWDFFNPFEGVRTSEAATAISGGIFRSSDEELRRVREQEGIPELEEERPDNGKEAEEQVVLMSAATVVREKEANAVEVSDSQKGEDSTGKGRTLTVMEEPKKKIELLDALKDVEEEFLIAYDSGKELARMLEVNKINIQLGGDEIKENSSKFIQAITWHRSFSLMSSSSRSNLGSSSKDNLPTESRSELFGDYGGMGSGCHSQTLGRLYAWEKKLYEEVKAGEQTWLLYRKKCLQIRHQDAKGSGSHAVDKSRYAAKNLYARIWVALRTIETISARILKLRDEELQPQVIELLQGLMRTWMQMQKSHERQKQVMLDLKAFTCHSYGRYCSDSQRQVTKKLEEQIENWRTCFKSYVAAHGSYVEALNGWLSKFFVPDMKYYNRTKSFAQSYVEGSPSPPLLLISQEWMSLSRRLPDRTVSISMKGFINNLRVLLAKQWEEQQQKKKVDSLTKEFDQRFAMLQKAENKMLEYKLSDLHAEPQIRDRVEHLAGRKDLMDAFRQKLDVEKAKHQNCMQETTLTTLNGFKMGLCSVFETLTEFSKASLDLYSVLLAANERAKVAAASVEEKVSEGSKQDR
ncbi:hypothetical protein HPP92_020729 [Vanilla planifolia]|uniref:Nitrate regulatory gene2 protein n=1 Tax=Vanilla planifolia TaxID=51239 RepID=A0A835UG60_VANPL|nr:hypothetical protein HPP92_020729 [Vanilla planifolia]